MVKRDRLQAIVSARLRVSPAVVLLGPRQCGKSTLARSLARGTTSSYFDLEDPRDRAALAAPMSALESLRGLVVIDEVQHVPGLFPVLRVLLDRRPLRARFLILGSASPDLLRQSSESLAGRIALVEMSGFSLSEVGAAAQPRLWLRGSFPRAFLARSETESRRWREDFVRTFLERDLPQLGVRVPADTLRRFWMMVAHYSGGIWNASEIGNSLGEAHTTVRRHLDVLSAALVLRVVPPWHEDLAKRQIKSPKVYLRDSGLLHTLLGVADGKSLLRHPKLGASWEGFVVEQVLGCIDSSNAYYWRTQSGAELDLLLNIRGERIGIEVKYSDAPTMTRSMHSAMQDLSLHQLWVVYPGTRRYTLAPRAEALSLSECMVELAKLSAAGARGSTRRAPAPRSAPSRRRQAPRPA
jgi:uncharacterized protein